jgi:hypothetical protein
MGTCFRGDPTVDSMLHNIVSMAFQATARYIYLALKGEAYPPWSTNEPNNLTGTEYCAAMYTSNDSRAGLWNDLDCTLTAPAACRSPDGQTWKITNNTSGTFLNGIYDCPSQFPGYTFQAPANIAEAQALLVATTTSGTFPNGYVFIGYFGKAGAGWTSDPQYFYQMGRWKLNGNLADSSTMQYNGTAVGSLSYAGDRIQSNGALTGFSTSSYGDMGDISAVEGIGAVTACGWIQTSGYYNGMIVAKHAFNSPTGSWYISTLSNGGVRMRAVADTSVVADSLTSLGYADGMWHHVCGVYDSMGGTNNVRVYLDGRLRGANTTTGLIKTNSYDVRIGNYETGDWPLTGGQIDDVRLWNRALADNEIAALYLQWQQIQGGLADIGAGVNVWGTNTSYVSWVFVPPSGWQQSVTGPYRLTAGASNDFWAINTAGSIFHETTPVAFVPGAQASDLGWGNNKLWIIDYNGAGPNYAVKSYDGSTWTTDPGGAAGTRISVTDAGVPWVITSVGWVYEWSGQPLWNGHGAPDAIDIGCGPASNPVWIVKRNGRLAYYSAVGVTDWRESTVLPQSTANAIDIASDGTVWVVANDGTIWRSTMNMIQ